MLDTEQLRLNAETDYLTISYVSPPFYDINWPKHDSLRWRHMNVL